MEQASEQEGERRDHELQVLRSRMRQLWRQVRRGTCVCVCVRIVCIRTLFGRRVPRLTGAATLHAQNERLVKLWADTVEAEVVPESCREFRDTFRCVKDWQPLVAPKRPGLERDRAHPIGRDETFAALAKLA